MSLQLKVNRKTEARLLDIARREGIEPTALIEKMVEEYEPRPVGNGENELGGKTAGELYGHLWGTVSFGPPDLSERDEECLTKSGFGETRNSRELNHRRGLGQ